MAVASAVTLAQTPDSGNRAEFEVASIRPANQHDSEDMDLNPGVFRTHNARLTFLIAEAYDVIPEEIFGGPKWLDSVGYDIVAKIPDQFAHRKTQDKLREMVQSLLADRFQLVIHREPRQISGYLLTVAKNGPKMKAVKGGETGTNLHSNSGHLIAEHVTMETLARHLTYDAGKIVADRTGLKGGFNFELDWAPAQPEPKTDAADSRPSIFTALKEQLGLKLEPARVPIQAIVIDRAEKPLLDGS